MRRPGTVEPEPLELVSPSSAEALRRCPLAVGFSRDSRYRPADRPSPAAALGSAAHAVLERVAGGQFDEVAVDETRAALEATWTASVESQHRHFREAVALIAAAPPEEWPGYYLARSRLLRRASDLLALRQGRGEAKSVLPYRVATETTLHAKSARAFGRPDRIERIGNKSTVVDTKTGALGEEVSPAHRRQLLFYAYLVHEEDGIWPQDAAIEGIDGQRHLIPVVPDEAMDVVQEATSTLERFNLAVAARQVEELADPSPDACRFCAYTGACNAFLGAVDPTWDIPGSSFAGPVTAIADAHDSRGVVTVAPVAGSLLASPSVHLLQVPTPMLPTVGDWVSVTRASNMAGSADFRPRWETEFWLWDGKGAASPVL